MGRRNKPILKERMLRRLQRDRRGAIAVEFALVMPVFIGMFMGMMEYSTVYFTYGAIQSATRDVTRQLAVNTLLPGNAQAEIKSRLPKWAQGDVTVLVSQSAPANPAINVITTTVELPISKATPIPFYTKAQTTDIGSVVEMKQELPFVEVK